MKKLLFTLTAILSFGILFISCDKEEVIQADQLPKEANTFLNTHFNGVKILQVEKEKEGLSGTEYKAILASGVQVKFDKNGDWTEVESNNNTAISTGFILAPIVKYIIENYANSGIKSIEKEKHGFDVELVNDIDLVFDKEGKFLRVDL